MMSSKFEQLPTLGVGASLSLSAKPDPLTLVNINGGPDFIEYAGCVDVDTVIDEVKRIHDAGVPVLFHPSYINFCGSFANDATWLEETVRHITSVGSPWFAQDCAYCFWQQGPGYSTQLGYFIPPILNHNSLQLAIQRVNEVQAVSPVTVVVEPPPVTFVVGNMPLLQFFGELSRATDCAILLDMGHLVSYEMASGKRIQEEMDDFPWERVIEVHIAGGRLADAAITPTAKDAQSTTRPIYIDAHECHILEQTWHMFNSMLAKLNNVKAVCYECEGVDKNTVLSTLQQIRRVVKKSSSSPALLACLAD